MIGNNKETTDMELSEQKNGKHSSKIKRFVIIAVFAVAAVWIIIAVYNFMCYESTDDAQIDGNIIPLKTTVSGYIYEIKFTDNQQVNKGDTLIVFDTIDLLANVKQAEAQLLAAQAGLSLSKHQVVAGEFNQNAVDFTAGSVKENIEAAKARKMESENNYNRILNMFSKGAATQQLLDNAEMQFSVAKAQLSALENDFQSSNARKSSANTQTDIYKVQSKADEAHIKQAEAQFVLAQNQLSHAFVIAPCDGVVSKRNVDVGQYATAGLPLATVTDLKNIWITANFKETQLKNMELGQTATVEVDAYPNLELKGKVESFCSATGAKFSILPAQNATGNFIKITQRIPVRISFENNSQKQLRPGMNVEVNVKTKE
ncbi:MAG: HlyD family secretion protein [Massilibacteroides sp.]|nr:HlyD family secretion protein [Bacteroidales bacterium]MDD2437718.1 HlyD family secretion protein [Massilibacteroides sp.]MDD3061752.1 HlyD family secretion protein [Massilibacteroides sp.]MDD4661484.1 HlyD family secretion protein [Massilibacteroides sp.]